MSASGTVIAFPGGAAPKRIPALCAGATAREGAVSVLHEPATRVALRIGRALAMLDREAPPKGSDGRRAFDAKLARLARILGEATPRRHA